MTQTLDTVGDGARPHGLRTHEPALAHDYLRAILGDHVHRSTPDRSAFRFEAHGVQFPLCNVGTVRCASSFAIECAPARPDVVVIEPDQHSALRLQCGDEHASGPVLLAPSWGQFSADADGIVFRYLVLKKELLERVGEEMTGCPVGTVTFPSMSPANAAAETYWRGLLTHVHQDLLPVEDPPHLLITAAQRNLASSLLALFPNDVTCDDHGSAGRSGPATIRRALAFMDAHGQDEIDVSDVARASGISTRGLQQAFQRHREQTPLQYLRMVRLTGAHRDLVAADSTNGATVASIATQWGFGQLGRFAATYRRSYGCLPSATLRS